MNTPPTTTPPEDSTAPDREPLGVVCLALVLPDLLPIPKPLYPCAHCRDEFSRYADELYWWDECKCWVCDDCWEEESHGEKGIRLDREIQRQNAEVSHGDRERQPDTRQTHNQP